MKHTIFLIASLLLITFTSTVKAQDEAHMKAWQVYMTPGDMHKLMGAWNGTWTVDVNAWADAKAVPVKSTAIVENKSLYNGLYQEGTFTGTMMGMPFQGKNILAYDNAKNEFVNIWVDNMGSGVIVMRGKYNDKTKTLDLTGTMTDPVTGKDSPIRESILIIDDNTQRMALYMPGVDGKEYKTMEMTMKRKVQ